MTEAEASDQLEQAVRAWLHACGVDDDGQDIVTGWVLVTEHISSTNPDVGCASITTSDGISLIRQLGILDYAQTLSRAHVTNDD